MAKETKPFSGHFDGDDPRYVTTAAGGCTWPTIPAHRYYMVSSNPTGLWSWLAYTGVLFQRTSPATVHDDCTWGLLSSTYPVTWAYLRRIWHPEENNITWRVEVMTIDCYFPAIATFDETPGKCNGIVALGEITCVGAGGGSGDGLKLLPVQFDKTLPETPWPPT